MKRPGRPLSPAEAELWKRVAATVTPLRGRRNPPRSGEGDQPLRLAGRPAAQGELVHSAQAPGGGGSSLAPHRLGRTKPPAPSTIPDQVRDGSPPRSGEDLKKPRPLAASTLDGTWDRKLSGGAVQPDFTLDLHGHTLESAHVRLDHGLTQALAQGARILLLITGKPRPSDDHTSRGSRRGAIRAKVLDWLALGPHASRIAAVRQAHPRHGGAGALYIVLKRMR